MKPTDEMMEVLKEALTRKLEEEYVVIDCENPDTIEFPADYGDWHYLIHTDGPDWGHPGAIIARYDEQLNVEYHIPPLYVKGEEVEKDGIFWIVSPRLTIAMMNTIHRTELLRYVDMLNANDWKPVLQEREDISIWAEWRTE
jgi:hypothetical protein